MATEVEKIKEITYNSTVTLALIEIDEDLKGIFTDEIKLPFNILYRLSEEDKLSDRTKELLVNIFDRIILTKNDLIDKYLRLAHNRGITINSVKEIEIEVEEDPSFDEEEGKTTQPIVDTKEKKTAVKKEKTGKELPKWYGKEKIVKDIERQGGTATPVQRAMIKLNDLKNLYFNLNTRGIKDMLADANTLSDEDCRKIVAAVTTFERQLQEVMKKKKK
jgi:hypothetical protein